MQTAVEGRPGAVTEVIDTTFNHAPQQSAPADVRLVASLLAGRG